MKKYTVKAKVEGTWECYEGDAPGVGSRWFNETDRVYQLVSPRGIILKKIYKYKASATKAMRAKNRELKEEKRYEEEKVT